MAKSIIQKDRRCFKTGVAIQLDKHHIMNGPSRSNADKDGLWVYLNHDVHMWLHQTKEGAKYARGLKEIAQQAYEVKLVESGLNRSEAHEAYMKRYHKNYL